MPTAATFRAIVSGARRGPGAAVLRAALSAAEVPYTLAVRWRNYGYDRGHTPAARAGVPVISVGNLTLGGTGKTPLVARIARLLAERGRRVVLVSRGYGATKGARNDEALELAQKLPDVPHLQNPDRVAAARTAIADHGAQLILLDDGFQHRRLARDLDIVLLDAVEPFGYGHVFPRGMLREPVSSLARADVIALSRADMVDDRRRAELRKIAAHHNPQAAWVEMRHAPQRLIGMTGQTAPLDALRGAKVHAFCGIGNPAGFRHTLDACGFAVEGLSEFPDHYTYTQHDAELLAGFARAAGDAALVCTHKDLVKLTSLNLPGVPVWAVEIGVEILSGEQELIERVEAAAGV